LWARPQTRDGNRYDAHAALPRGGFRDGTSGSRHCARARSQRDVRAAPDDVLARAPDASAGPDGEQTPCRHRPAHPGPGISAPRLPRTRRLDPEWRAWLEGLRGEGWARQAAIGRLYALLLREARHEVRRSTAALAHPSGRDLDDLSLQAADDALVAILGKLDQLRGDALFTTGARRFDALEVPDKTRRRLEHTRETPTDADHWPPDPVSCEDPHACIEAVELARILACHGIGPRSRWRWAGVELRES